MMHVSTAKQSLLYLALIKESAVSVFLSEQKSMLSKSTDFFQKITEAGMIFY